MWVLHTESPLPWHDNANKVGRLSVSTTNSSSQHPRTYALRAVGNTKEEQFEPEPPWNSVSSNGIWSLRFSKGNAADV